MKGTSNVNIDKSTPSSKNIYVAKSFRISIINWWNVVFGLYFPYIFYMILAILIGMIYPRVSLTQIYTNLPIMMEYFWMGLVLVVGLLSWNSRRACPTYLLDFACFDAPEEWKLSHDELIEVMKLQNTFTQDSLDFMKRLLEKSGTSHKTAWPKSMWKSVKERQPAVSGVKESREEAETVMFKCIQDALDKSGIKPREVDILIVNCSLFSPTPSLSSMCVSHFGFRQDIKAYNLSGMGCSAGVIAIDLAKQLLQANANAIALVVSTEILTPNLYLGNERSMLVQNTLFRVGGAAMVLSNKWQHAFQAKYKLLHTVRVQNAKEEEIRSVYEMEDKESIRGIHLSKDIVRVAGRALKLNLTHLGPLILPLREQFRVFLSFGLIRARDAFAKWLTSNKITPMLDQYFFSGLQAKLTAQFPLNQKPIYYVPDFKRAIDHFCIHAGGRAVIDGVEKNLSLEPCHVEPSRHTLYNYGNTSSSSIWYELRFIEQQGHIQRGHRVLQMGFGSGFKCNSAVWLRLR